MNFFSAGEEETVAFLEDHDATVNPPEEIWFSAEEGLKTITAFGSRPVKRVFSHHSGTKTVSGRFAGRPVAERSLASRNRRLIRDPLLAGQ
jgi:hypothetical protein